MIVQDINNEEAIQAIETIDNRIEEQHVDEIPNQQPWSGFKLVGDNIDKNFSMLNTKHVHSTIFIVMPFLIKPIKAHCQVFRETRLEYKN